MAKVAAEATGRQAASFVLGCVAALTVVLLLQRRPEDLITRPVAPVQFFGGRSSSSSSGRDGTCSCSSPSSTPTGPPPVIVAADHHSDATKQPGAAGAATDATADDLSRLPASPAHRQQEEVGSCLLFVDLFLLLRSSLTWAGIGNNDEAACLPDVYCISLQRCNFSVFCCHLKSTTNY